MKHRDTVTYGDAMEMLSRLGFTEKRTEEGYWVFYERAHDALIALPNVKRDAVVPPHEFVMVRRTLVAKDILTADRFAEMWDALALNHRADVPTAAHR